MAPHPQFFSDDNDLFAPRIPEGRHRRPLADRLLPQTRPTSPVISSLTGETACCEDDRRRIARSMIFWGPPGPGKRRGTDAFRRGGLAFERYRDLLSGVADLNKSSSQHGSGVWTGLSTCFSSMRFIASIAPIMIASCREWKRHGHPCRCHTANPSSELNARSSSFPCSCPDIKSHDEEAWKTSGCRAETIEHQNTAD